MTVRWSTGTIVHSTKIQVVLLTLFGTIASLARLPGTACGSPGLGSGWRFRGVGPLNPRRAALPLTKKWEQPRSYYERINNIQNIYVNEHEDLIALDGLRINFTFTDLIFVWYSCPRTCMTTSYSTKQKHCYILILILKFHSHQAADALDDLHHSRHRA